MRSQGQRSSGIEQVLANAGASEDGSANGSANGSEPPAKAPDPYFSS